MDFRFTEAQEGFRQQVRQFLDKELPPGWTGLGGWVGFGGWSPQREEDYPIHRAFERKLAEKGWLTMAWPKEYGGQERSHIEQLIYTEEMSYRRAPGMGSMGVAWVGPTIMLYGDEEQKRGWVPKIAKAEVEFSTGYSEPNAGSDLASLQARAIEDGDDFIINGQKVWTSGGHHSDYCWLAARTDPTAPKHRGISVFIVDMKSPGITVRPLIDMTGFHHFNELYLDDVRVPKRNLVGQKNQGWYYLVMALAFERSGIGIFAAAGRSLEDLVQYVQETKHNGKPLAADAIIRHKLAELAVEIEVGRTLAYRIAWMQNRGQVPNVEASMSKLYGSELNQRLARAALGIMRLYGQLHMGSKWAPLEGEFVLMSLRSVGNTIEQGTSEIQRNIIAQRGLGLPR